MDGYLVLFGSFLAGLILLVAVGAFSEDTTEWTKIDDKCSVKVETVRSIWSDDFTTREVYCKK